MYVINNDFGCGLIRGGAQKIYSGQANDYTDLAANRKPMLNLISPRAFLMKFP